jgi:UDPglucose 6-dehydrogenase
VKEVAVGMGYDKRIGPMFLDAGLGYGGSCFPKDVKALAYMAEEKGRHPQLLRAVMEINDDRRRLAVKRLRELVGDLQGAVIGLLGLSFKPNTDDMRDAPLGHPCRPVNQSRRQGASIRSGSDARRPHDPSQRGNVHRSV